MAARVNPDAIAERLFPGSNPVDRECRRAISEIASARQWHELGRLELDSLEETVWADLLEIRNPDEYFDGLSARAAESSAGNAQRFFARSSRHLSAAVERIETAHRERELSILAEAAMRRRGE
jgi:hypothetical protein